MDDLSTLWGSNTAQTDIARKEYAPIPTGVYSTYIVDVAIDATVQPNRVTIKYKITDDGPYSNRIIFANFTLTDKGTPILKSEMLRLGYSGKPKNMDELSGALKAMIGHHAKVKATERQYTGRDGTLKQAHSVYVQSTITTPTTAPVNNAAPSMDFDEPLSF